MANLLAPSPSLQLCWSFQFGPILRENGQSRPISLDAIRRDFGAREVDRIMEEPGRFLAVEPIPAHVATPTPAPTPQTPTLPDVHPGTPPMPR